MLRKEGFNFRSSSEMEIVRTIKEVIPGEPWDAITRIVRDSPDVKRWKASYRDCKNQYFGK